MINAFSATARLVLRDLPLPVPAEIEAEARRLGTSPLGLSEYATAALAVCNSCGAPHWQRATVCTCGGEVIAADVVAACGHCAAPVTIHEGDTDETGTLLHVDCAEAVEALPVARWATPSEISALGTCTVCDARTLSGTDLCARHR